MKRISALLLVASVTLLIYVKVSEAAMQCYDCHGTSATTDYRPDDAAYRNITTGAFKGNHRTHMGTGATPATCTACHGPGAAAYTNAHRNGQVNIAANINNSPKAGGATYSRGASFAQSANPALGTCSSVNCHFESVTPVWNETTFASPADCNRCHGTAPNTGSHPVAGAKHAAYYGTTTASCGKCHPDHAAEGSPFAHATSAGKRDLSVSFAAAPNSGSGAYSGDLNDYLPSQSNTFGNCTATYCHSPGNKESGFDAPVTAATWGGSLTCTGCHKADKLSGTPLTSGSHQGHINGMGIGYTQIKCVKCHAATANSSMTIISPANHVDKQVTIAFNNSSSAANGSYNGQPATPGSPSVKAPGSAVGQCANVYCHSSGQGAGGTWPPTYQTPTWGTASTGQCGTCHGIQTKHDSSGFGYGTATPLASGSHTRHLSFALGTGNISAERKCAACHSYTLTGYTPAACSSASCHTGMVLKHANYEINVGMPDYYGATATYNAASLTPGTGYSSCSNVYCHSDGKVTPTIYATPTWGNAASGACGTCHGVTAANTPASTPHGKHVGSGNPYRIACAECHSGKVQITANSTTAPAFTNLTSHVDKVRNVKFDASNPFGTYSTASLSCRNLYCHSTGNTSVAAGNLPGVYGGKVYARQTWSGTTTCASCHGRSTANGMPDYANAGTPGSATSNSHQKHVVSSAIQCAECHEKTTKNNTSIRSTAPGYHVNGTNHDVFFNLSGNSAAGTYDDAQKKCSATYCHGAGASLGWGGSTQCNSCHSANAASSGGGGVNNWGSGTPASAHKLHWEDASALPAKYTNYSTGNLGSAGTYRFACASCHNPAQAVHVSGYASGSYRAQVFFGYTAPGKKPTYTYTGAAGTADNGFAWSNGNTACTATYCHSNGAGGAGNTAVSWATTANSATNVRCKSCHSYTTASGSAMGTGTHGKHITGSTYGMNCAKCHSGTTSDGTSIADKIKHVNKAANVAWDATNSDGSAYADPNCSNIYCHSKGTANASPYAAPNTVASWGGSLDATCSGCHGGDSGATSKMGAVGSATHTKHIVTYGYGCKKCHAATVSANRTIGTYANHVNKLVNVAFNNTTTAVGGTYAGSASPMTKAPGSAMGNCANTYCHSKGTSTTPVAPNVTATWGGSLDATCTGCHNGDNNATNKMNTASHTKHVQTYGYDCAYCHAATATNSRTIGTVANHANRQVDVQFNAWVNSAATYAGATPKAKLPGSAVGACASTYCHSNGTSVSSGSIPANTTVNWGTAGPLACDDCHGNPPDYANNSPKKNSHAKHNYACNTCHNATTTNATSITTVANHVNKTYNVTQGGTATFTYTYNAGGGTCATISCHGGNSATWGATLKCQDCHLSTSDTDNFSYNDGTTAKVKNVGEWDTTGHGKASGTYTSGNAAAAFTAANACLYCHESSVSHGDGANVFRLKNFAHATWGKNGVCMSCHATGSAGVTVDSVLKNGGKKVSAYHYGADHTALKSGGQFCWDCHDPHGDTNVYMVHNAVAKVSNSTTAVPTTTANVTFTAFATGTDYAGANATKLCNACHTTASHYAGASGDGHNSGARCTGCHSHNNSDNNTYGFQAGESTGGSACGACHSDLYNADQTKYSMHSNVAGISYKHYLDNDAATYSTTLPNGPSTNVTSRRCTMCHVDHDIFRVNATATAGRAFNIRPNASVTPTSGSNTDLTNCVSCHYQVSTKAIAAPNAEDDSVSIPFPGLTFANATSIVKNSTHGYVVKSQEFADATRGNTTFYANCTKCHNDTIGRNDGAKSSYNAQDGTAGSPSRSRFGNHMTTNNNYYSVFNNAFFQGTASSATNVTNATITVTGAGWTVNQWTGYYVVTTGGTGQNQRKMITSNTATVLTLSGTFTTALDATTKFDIVQSPISTDNVCFACHSKRNQGKGARAGFDWYSSEHMKPALESLKDTFVILAQTGTVSSWTAGGSGVGPTVTDSSKSWTANQWQNYTVKFANGVVRKITSNTATVLTLTYNKKIAFAVSNGMAYEIFKPSYHPLDSYGRHDSIERVTPVKRSWNQGDMGKITATISTTQFKDDTRAWSAGQWNSSTITFPRQGVTSTISSVTVDANGVPTVTFSPAVSGLAVNDPYYVGTRHVSCADCHNSHAAQPYPFGDVTAAANAGTSTLQANDAKNPAGARKWVDNQWTGYLLKVRRASDNLEQIRYITAYNSTTGTFTVGLPWNTAISAGDDFWVITSDRWTSAGHDAGRSGAGSAGVWGIQVGNFTAPAAGSFQNMTTATYTKIENVYDRTGSRGGNATAGQRDMCVRCHSYYAWGRKPPTTTTPGPQSAADAAVGPVASTDVAQEFNPNNASHHAVYARGNNQPIKANYGNTNASYGSWYNPNWPKYSTANGGDTVSMTNGTVTFAGTAALPRTALPGWYLYIGADSITATASAVNGTGTTANGTGFLEITSITSPTSFTVRAVNSSAAWVTNPTLTGSSANWFVTAGLGNSFIPPYGPWSILICTDCHGSTKTDPLGPHASANDFLLKSLDTNIRFEWYDGSAIQSIQPNNKTATILDTNMGRQIFCWNCHRSDVYANSALHGAATRANMGRVPHDLFYCSSNTTPSSSLKLEAYPTTAMPPGWQLWCKHCHGGDKLGGTHGTNTTFATGDVAGQARKRFLNGATWVGYGKSTTTTTQTCYTQDGTSASNSAVSQCGQHSGGRGTSINAIYNYW